MKKHFICSSCGQQICTATTTGFKPIMCLKPQIKVEWKEYEPVDYSCRAEDAIEQFKQRNNLGNDFK